MNPIVTNYETHPALQEFNPHIPFPDIYPESFKTVLPSVEYLSFRNLQHFKYVVSKLNQKEDNMCGVSYKQAVEDLLSGNCHFKPDEVNRVRNLVRSKLHKRGLISQEVYEEFMYTVDGTQVGVDAARYAAGLPDCVISPAKEYVDYFYELYINAVYQWDIDNKVIQDNCAKVLATIEELERKHIWIKMTLVLPIRNCGKSSQNFFSDIPVFSHKEPKTFQQMASVINERLLRKFYFAILENYFGDQLRHGKGFVVKLDKQLALNIGYEFDEVKFFEDVLEHVGA